MGCDIHRKVFLYDSNKKEYIDVNGHYDPDYDIVYDNPFGSTVLDMFDILGERYYDFFGIMGNNSRSSMYRPLRCLKYDFPEYLKKFLKKDFEYRGNYGFCYCRIDKLIKGFTSYRNRLKKLKKREVHKYIIRHLGYVIEELSHLEDLKDNAEFNIICDLNGYKIDFSKTMLVFFFDN